MVPPEHALESSLSMHHFQHDGGALLVPGNPGGSAGTSAEGGATDDTILSPAQTVITQ